MNFFLKNVEVYHIGEVEYDPGRCKWDCCGSFTLKDNGN